MNIFRPMKTMASISTLCAVLAIAAVSPVSASGFYGDKAESRHHQGAEGHRGKMMKKMVKALSLSEPQQEQIKAVKAQAKAQHETLRTAMKEFKTQEKLLLQAESFDEQAYSALHASYQPTFEQMAIARAKTKHAMFKVLTTEQQEKWLKIMKKRKEKARKNRS